MKSSLDLYQGEILTKGVNKERRTPFKIVEEFYRPRKKNCEMSCKAEAPTRFSLAACTTGA